MGPVPVVVVGDTLAELVVPASPVDAGGSRAPDPHDLLCRPAGAGAITAAWLSQLRTPTTLVGRVGDDPLGRAIAADLADRRIAVRLRVVTGCPTGTVVVLTSPDGDAHRAYEPGAAATLSPDDLPADLMVTGGHLHLTGHALIDPAGPGVAAAAIDRARAAGMTVSAAPPPLPILEAMDPAAARATLAGLDVLVLGQAQAFALVEDLDEAARDQPERLAALLARTVAQVVVTAGPYGAWWHGRREAPAHAPGPATGAGFVAGFLAAWLLDTSPAQALRSGSTVAAQALAASDSLPDDGGSARVRS